jgi:hypothetical protein|tara:strand:+ start:217 stop:498 length:282 start_codon:yes stop_codon:yes gene_type:complete
MTKLIETVLVSGVWGLSVSSLVWGLELEGFTTVIQLAVAIAGLGYLIFIKIPHEWKINKMNRRRAKLQNQVLKHEIEDYEEEEAYNIKKDEDK